MSTLLVVLVAAVMAVVLIRRLTEARIACNSCLRVVSKRRMTVLADGRLICNHCLKSAISSTMQGAISKLPGAKEEGAFALETHDRRIGEARAVCGQKLRALDPVCVSSD